jgi:hypothetical protein
MISMRRARKVPPFAFKSQLYLSLSVIRTRAIYACQCKLERVSCLFTRSCHARSVRKVAYAARPFSVPIRCSPPTVLVMRSSSRWFANSAAKYLNKARPCPHDLLGNTTHRHSSCAFSFGSQSYASRSNLSLSLSPQLGNYFGALANWVRLQDAAAPEDKLFFSVVGWHALTLPQDPKALLEARTTMIALILASGVDPRRSIIFHQDEVKATLLLGILAHAPTTGSKPHRAGMDSELHNAAWEAETDDHLESTSFCEDRESDDNLNYIVDAAGGFKERQ